MCGPFRIRGPYRDEMRAILRDGEHPDGRPLGRALAQRLADAFGMEGPGASDAAEEVR